VIDRRYLRQSLHSSALPRLFLFNIPTCKPSNIPTFGFPYLLPSSVSRKSFACHSYENCRGVYQQFPFWLALSRAEGFTQSDLREGNIHRSPLAARLPRSCRGHWPLSFNSCLFTLLRTLLRLQKTQPVSFQATPNSLQKTTRGGGRVHSSQSRAGSILWVAL
jgi:hypothetical protein